MLMSMDLGTGLWVWEQIGNTWGDPWYGRPARYVRKGAIIGSPTFSKFHSVYILTLKTGLDTRHPLMHPPPGRPRHHQRAFALPPLPSHARPSRGGGSWLFDAILTSSTSLACQSEPEVVSTPFMPPPPPSHTKLNRRGTFMVFPRRSHLFQLVEKCWAHAVSQRMDSSLDDFQSLLFHLMGAVSAHPLVIVFSLCRQTWTLSIIYSHPSLQPIAKRLTLPDSEINRTHQNPVLGFVVLGLISQ